MKSDHESVITRLLAHAGLSRADARSNELCMVIFTVKQTDYAELDHSALVSCIGDIVLCIDKINRLSFVSRLHTAPSHRNLPDHLTYAISEIMRILISALRDSAEFGTSTNMHMTLAEAAELISVAWSAFMAGDIEDLTAEVQTTAAFRNGVTEWFPRNEEK